MLISSRELCRRTSASYRQIDYWSRVGIFGPIGTYFPGSGHTREWDEFIVDKVRLLAKISRFFGRQSGVSTETLIKIYENYEKGSISLEAGEGIILSWKVKEGRERTKNPKCDVEVGTHHGPYWATDKMRVCDRHKKQYEERILEFGPFDWRPVD